VSQHEEFAEQRRLELDTYLQQLLRSEEVQANPTVHELFLPTVAV
jgi:hypothetical protein